MGFQLLTDEQRALVPEVKEALKQIKTNANPDEVKRLQDEFQALIGKASPVVIALAEQELLNEGYTFDDLKLACDVHLALFKNAFLDSLLKVPEGHPIDYFQKEHKAILDLLDAMKVAADQVRLTGNLDVNSDNWKRLVHYAEKLMDAENHNVRQENTIFPLLEKHGVSAPPAIMWAEHTEMKEEKKALLRFLKEPPVIDFKELTSKLTTMIRVLTEKFFAHTQKEMHILYQTAMEVLSEEEWKDIKEECDNLGYFDLKID